MGNRVTNSAEMSRMNRMLAQNEEVDMANPKDLLGIKKG